MTVLWHQLSLFRGMPGRILLGLRTSLATMRSVKQPFQPNCRRRSTCSITGDMAQISVRRRVTTCKTPAEVAQGALLYGAHLARASSASPHGGVTLLTHGAPPVGSICSPRTHCLRLHCRVTTQGDGIVDTAHPLC